MSVDSVCPDPQELRRLALGQLAPAEVERLARHLEQCDRCAAAVQSMPAEDALAEAVRARGVAHEEGRPEAVQRLIERLKVLRVPIASSVAEGIPATAADPLPRAYSFLAPPQGPDEIGRLGPYRVLRPLGTGGMGVVFLAVDPQLDRPVALKVMLPSLAASDSAHQRFLREAKAAAAVRHDHVVTIHHVGIDRGVPYLAMELLPGESLEERLRREGSLPAAEVLRIGRETAEGLAAAHERGLVHRDIKPANIWLESPSGRVKILDFGLARAAAGQAPLTQAGGIVGTPAFMAPEQARGEAVDARTDLFSLGGVLYQAATGQLPFPGRDAVATLMAVATEPPKPPRQLNPQVPPALGELILWLLAKAPRERPASAHAVVEVIQAIKSGAHLPTRPTARPGRRILVWVAAVAVCVGLLAAAGAFCLPTWISATTTGSGAPPGWKWQGDLDILIWEKDNPRRQHLHLGDPGALPLQAGDQYDVTATLNRPAYLYLLWVDTAGEVWPLFPWQPGEWGERPIAEQPIDHLRRPEALDEWYDLPMGPPGMETLVLLARETPLAADVDLRAELGPLPRQKEQDMRAAVWFEDGRVVTDRPNRGGRFDARKSTDPVMLVQQRLRELQRRHGFVYTRAVSFANRGR